jgi:hypothetical protein
VDEIIGQLQHLRPGELLRVSCPMTHTRVADVSGFYASVEWPWRQIDRSSQFRWNGQRAFRRSAESSEWIGSLFRTDPEPWHLSAGDECQVGIPETLVQLVSVHHWDPPRDIGWLPRPNIMLWVIPPDHPEYADLEDAGDSIAFPSAEPITLERAGAGQQS